MAFYNLACHVSFKTNPWVTTCRLKPGDFFRNQSVPHGNVYLAVLKDGRLNAMFLGDDKGVSEMVVERHMGSGALFLLEEGGKPISTMRFQVASSVFFDPPSEKASPRRPGLIALDEMMTPWDVQPGVPFLSLVDVGHGDEETIVVRSDGGIGGHVFNVSNGEPVPELGPPLDFYALRVVF